MKFGNWQVKETTIDWIGQTFQRFSIDKQSLLQTTTVQKVGEKFYQWIVLATDEEWMTVDDLYDLNFAFVYAAGAWQLPLDYEIFDKTVEYQYDLLDEEDGIEP